MNRPIYVAIDTVDLDRAKAIAIRVKPHVGGIKLGLEFFSAHGPDGVREMADFDLPLFIDLKLHDIPNTVAKAIQALRPLEPAILTVHAAGGRAMMEDAKAAAPSGTRVVGVTMLTSLDCADMDSIGVDSDPHAQVQRLTALAREAGLDGVVCSGNEVAAAKKAWPEGFFVVPGVRPADGAKGDQKRVMTARSPRPTIPTRPRGRSRRRFNPPRHGEGDHAKHRGGGSVRVSGPLHRLAAGPPPRSGEEYIVFAGPRAYPARRRRVAA
jgi:orotidine-5'-phosphate decarboxylase